MDTKKKNLVRSAEYAQWCLNAKKKPSWIDCGQGPIILTKTEKKSVTCEPPMPRARIERAASA